MVVKSQVVLYIYDELINDREIKINNIICEYGISIRTFRRYIAEINAYLCNNFRNEVVVYDSIKRSYYLKKNKD